jgi:DNA-binding response OmpR family regulator
VTPLGAPRVLIVEDDPDLLVVLRVNLTSAGIEAILAGDGVTAVERIQREKPDAVILDVMLPGLDGWQVLEELHAIGDPTPVIVCSGKKNPQDMDRAAALGASAYVVKPFDIDRLMDAVEGAVSARRSGLHLPLPDAVAEPVVGLESA